MFSGEICVLPMNRHERYFIKNELHTILYYPQWASIVFSIEVKSVLLYWTSAPQKRKRAGVCDPRLHELPSMLSWTNRAVLLQPCEWAFQWPRLHATIYKFKWTRRSPLRTIYTQVWRVSGLAGRYLITTNPIKARVRFPFCCSQFGNDTFHDTGSNITLTFYIVFSVMKLINT